MIARDHLLFPVCYISIVLSFSNSVFTASQWGLCITVVYPFYVPGNWGTATEVACAKISVQTFESEAFSLTTTVVFLSWYLTEESWPSTLNLLSIYSIWLWTLNFFKSNSMTDLSLCQLILTLPRVSTHFTTKRHSVHQTYISDISCKPGLLCPPVLPISNASPCSQGCLKFNNSLEGISRSKKELDIWLAILGYK